MLSCLHPPYQEAVEQGLSAGYSGIPYPGFPPLPHRLLLRNLTLSQLATKLDSATEVGAAMGESRDMVFRYIRLTNLVPPLLDMVDEGKIALMPAERLSYLTEEEQLALVDITEDLEVTPSLSQAVKLKDLSASHRLDPDSMYEVMEKPKANQRETVKLDADTLRRFFPDYTPKQMETAILRMLEEAERERPVSYTHLTLPTT